MKKISLLLVFLLQIISFTACQKETMPYSCNKAINTWTKINLASIQKMDRVEFLTLSPAYQKAVFRAFNPQQRKNIWRTKLEETLSLDWSEAEKNHIAAILKIFNKYPNLFSSDFLEKDELLIDVYRWKKYAVETFGWDNNVIRSIIGNPNKLENKTGKVQIIHNNTQVQASNQYRKRDCDCHGNLGEGIILDDCAEPGCYETTDCNSSLMGCGYFWIDPCTGICWIAAS